jgi:valyl-tRNA synthetase
MELPKTYDPKSVEDKWYAYWLEKKFFRSVPDEREPYTIVIPPPNVTGVLHMGHMLNNTIQDVLIRRARMMGKNACWVPGTDHASIATEAKVVALLKEKGIKKTDITREEFLKYAWEWKEKYGGIILEQLKKLGASCDWDRTRFTMEESLSEAVIDVFIDLHKKGHIYRGVRMVNWDPAGMTAVSDEEVIYKEVNSKLFYVKYKIEGTDEWITVATTRPETILGDTAVCVHPEDERYKHLKGKHAIIPMVNRAVPIIFDDYIDKEFGTGALKVTPAHDINDYNLGVKHKLEVIDTIAPDGKMSPAAKFYVGEDRFVVRKKIVKDLEEMGQLVKTEDIKNKVGFSERTDAVIEPKLSMQWFLKMKEISKPALDAVMKGEVNLIPDKFINTYKHWMENVHDWCISRQLWWGQRIPAWYDDKENCVVAKTRNEAEEQLRTLNSELRTESVRQDADVVDTWFSSWLWPISVFDGFKDPKNKDIAYYYPTNDLVTAPEILFFWVARMIIAGYEYRGEKPFTNVYLTGIVRDKQGRKMSKSLGNSPDPIDLINKFGADGVRMGMLLCSPAGNDLPFDESYCEQGRNFSNKIWNAFRLIKGWEVQDNLETPEVNKIAIKWFNAKFQHQLDLINDHFAKYRISDALMTTYKLVWDDFCSWYLELIKPNFIEGKSVPTDSFTYNNTVKYFEDILRVLHPFMPFITEEIWHLIKEREELECVMVNKWPINRVLNQSEENLIKKTQEVFDYISRVRDVRSNYGISPSTALPLMVVGIMLDNDLNPILTKLGNVTVKEISNPDPRYYMLTSGVTSVYIDKEVLGINPETERTKLYEELEYYKGFLVSIHKKLSNQKFVQNARPEIISLERKKQADAELKIKLIEKQIQNIK